MAGRFQGQHAVMTGGASGIGAAVLAKLQAEGARVTALDLADCPAADRHVPLNIADQSAIDAAVAQIDGPVDCLFNIAGVPPREENGALVLAVNFFGLRHFTDAMLGRLSDQAAIVNMASLAGAQWVNNIEEVKALLAMADSVDPAAALAELGIDATRAYNLSK